MDPGRGSVRLSASFFVVSLKDSSQLIRYQREQRRRKISEPRKFILSSKEGSYELGQGEILVGRSRSCQLVLPDPSISRSHALLIVHGDEVSVKDLDSSNGTYVNAKQIREETPLALGDRLSVGETVLVLEVLEPEPKPKTASPITPSPVLLPKLHLPTEGPTRTAGAEEDSAFDSGEVIHEAFRRLSPEAAEEAAEEAAGDQTSHGVRAPGLRVPTSKVPAPSVPPSKAPGSKAPGSKAPTSGELLPSLDDFDGFDDLSAAPLGSAPVAASTPGSSSPSSRELRPASDFPPAAGFWIRAAAAALDWLLILVVASLVSLVAGGPWRPEGNTLLVATCFALGVLVPIFGWSIWGTTPGKRLFSLYVLSVDTSRTVPVGQALLRFVGYFVSLLAFGAGFFMVGFTAARRGLHDVIAGTYVARRG